MTLTISRHRIDSPMIPSVCIILLAYNQASYIEQTLDSIFSQDYPNISVLLSDDCSSDTTYDIMIKYAKQKGDRVKVRLNRNENTLGVVAHFNKAVRLIDEKYIIYQAGDDISRSDRVSKLIDVLSKNPELTFVESNYVEFSTGMPEPYCRKMPTIKDAEPLPVSFFSGEDYLARMVHLSSSTRAFRKSAVLKFPDLNPMLPSEDSCTAMRLFYTGNGAKVNLPLLYKRIHDSNVTGPNNLKRMNFDVFRKQYEQDAEFAHKLNIISREGCDKIKKWALRTTKRRQLRLLFDYDRPSIYDLIGKVIPSKYLNLQEKMYAIRCYFFAFEVRTREYL